MASLDTRVLINLPLRDWQVVYALLDGAPHRDVVHIIASILAQAGPQLEAAEALERASQAAAAPSEATQPADAPVLN